VFHWWKPPATSGSSQGLVTPGRLWLVSLGQKGHRWFIDQPAAVRVQDKPGRIWLFSWKRFHQGLVFHWWKPAATSGCSQGLAHQVEFGWFPWAKRATRATRATGGLTINRLRSGH
jgi:hypothetical protein